MIILSSKKAVVKQALTADSIVIATSLMETTWQQWTTRFVILIWSKIILHQFSTDLQMKHLTL